MAEFEHELRLCWALALNTALFVAARRTAETLGDGERLQKWLDTLLLWWAGQYVIVGGLGLIGCLSPLAISITTVALAAAAMSFCHRTSHGEARPAPPTLLELGLAFVVAYVAAVIWGFRDLPAMADDPLTYHLPAAARWLQTGWISLHETWYFNPANTYSPLAGSVFAVWLIAPFQSDVFARFMQAPAVVAIFLGGVQIAHRLGAPIVAAVLLGAAAALCRPIVGQAALAKDDLFLAAFVLIAIVGIGRVDRLSPWRIGIAIGLAAATKYTAVYSLLPLALLAWPARRPAWRAVAVGLGCVLLLAFPWYLRNWICFGNPFFPVAIRPGGIDLFPGIFTTTVTPRLRELNGLKEVFVTGYFSLGAPLAIAALATWLVAAACAGKRAIRDPIARIIVFGPLIGIGAFVLTSPYGEVRFVYVWVIVMITAGALWPHKLRLPLAAVLCACSIATSFELSWMVEFVIIATAGTLLVAGATALARRWPAARAWMAVAALLVGAGSVWVWWRAYVDSLPQLASAAWRDRYGPLGEAWELARTKSRPGDTIAVTGTYLTYPLMGARLDRRALYVPVSSSVGELHRVAPISTPLSARTMLRQIIPATQVDADKDLWIRRLDAEGAKLLLINFRPPAFAPVPIEWSWVSRDRRFNRILLNHDVALYTVEIGPKSQ